MGVRKTLEKGLQGAHRVRRSALKRGVKVTLRSKRRGR